jgi:2-keto-3-deoxy-L-rhamnonate aldolase RhmA
VNTSLKTGLQRGDVLFGPMLTLACPDVSDMFSRAGFDWLWIELEHATMSLETVQQMLQAAGGRVPCIVRSPWNDHVWLKRILDTGCDGVVIPQIRSADEATSAVAACRYSPLGHRSVGIGRAHGFGLEFKEYLARANDELTIVLQIEHIDGVNQIEAILSVPGWDAVMIGPYDLSASMNMIGQVESPEVQAAIRRVKDACKAKRKPYGIFAPDLAIAKRQIADGCTMLLIGVDATILANAGKSLLAQIHS